MSWVAAAIGGSAILGAIGSSKAAGAQKDAADTAAATERYMYDQSREDMAPYRDVGANALYQMADLYGLGYDGSGSQNAFTPELNAQGQTYEEARSAYDQQGSNDPSRWLSSDGLFGSISDRQYGGSAQPFVWSPVAQNGPSVSDQDRQQNAMSKFYKSPGYQFRLDEGQRMVENSAAARGGLLSGNTLRSLATFGQGSASGEYGDYWNRLAGLAGTGQTATNQTAGYGAQAARGIGNANIAAGQARGSGYMGMANSLGSGLNNWAGYQGWQNAAPQPPAGGAYGGGYGASPYGTVGYNSQY